MTGTDYTDALGHVWAAVWNKALAEGVPSDVAKQLADVAQHAADQVFGAGQRQ